MSVKLATLKSDTKKEADGDWQEVAELPGVRLKVRSFNYPQYRIERDLLVQRMARKHKGKPAPGEETEIAFGKLYARLILLDWEGFDVPYSEQVALESLTDPAFRDLRRYVETAAANVGQAEVEFTEEVVKKSASGGSGK